MMRGRCFSLMPVRRSNFAFYEQAPSRKRLWLLAAHIKIPHADARVEEGKIGVIKVYSLEESEAADIRADVQNLMKQGVQKIVLDLRGVFCRGA